MLEPMRLWFILPKGIFIWKAFAVINCDHKKGRSFLTGIEFFSPFFFLLHLHDFACFSCLTVFVIFRRLSLRSKDQTQVSLAERVWCGRSAPPHGAWGKRGWGTLRAHPAAFILLLLPSLFLKESCSSTMAKSRLYVVGWARSYVIEPTFLLPLYISDIKALKFNFWGKESQKPIWKSDSSPQENKPSNSFCIWFS